jgi:transcriptional regulator with XRE-family HTH domain
LDLRDVFAANLRRLRNAKGLSQDDLAYEAEMSRSYLSQLEKGAFYASLKIIGRLADAAGCRASRISEAACRKKIVARSIGLARVRAASKTSPQRKTPPGPPKQMP